MKYRNIETFVDSKSDKSLINILEKYPKIDKCLKHYHVLNLIDFILLRRKKCIFQCKKLDMSLIIMALGHVYYKIRWAGIPGCTDELAIEHAECAIFARNARKITPKIFNFMVNLYWSDFIKNKHLGIARKIEIVKRYSKALFYTENLHLKRIAFETHPALISLIKNPKINTMVTAVYRNKESWKFINKKYTHEILDRLAWDTLIFKNYADYDLNFQYK